MTACRHLQRIAGTAGAGLSRRVALRGLATLAVCGFGTSCGPGAGPDGRVVVVYAAQDRLHAEPLLAAFSRSIGIEVRAVYDNEATKTTGLANRLLAERARPLADVWWSNEEMRTRQLEGLGILEPGWGTFGVRRRVLVCREVDLPSLPIPPSLSALTRPELRGRVAMAYPLFGSTAAHLMMLRQRWGDDVWAAWCEALGANRVLWVDGNSLVVRRVVAGDALLGLTDTDDVEAARREGARVVAIPIPEAEDLQLPNTVAVVRGAPHPQAAAALAAFLLSPSTAQVLVDAGAISPGPAPRPDPAWPGLLRDLDTVTRRMEGMFRR